MPTLAAGTSTEVYFNSAGSLTITPGAGGSVRVDVAVRQGMAAVDVASPVHSAKTISVPGGATVFLEAVRSSATYSSVPGDGVLYSGPQLLAVSIGNSINGNASGTRRNNAAGADPSGWWNTGSAVMFANALAGAPLRFGRIGATTRADKWAAYSYGGQTLATIMADLPAQLYGPMDTAGMLPDLIIGHGLLENDISVEGASTATCTARLNQWIRAAQGRYPSARLLICTPHPSYSYDTAAKVSTYQAMRDYTLGLDDGRRIFVCRVDVYEDPANPGKPLAGFTDASVHPTTAGGTRIAREAMLPTLRRIAAATFPAYRRTSLNFAAAGTAAASGTGVSGTVATGYSHGGTANGTVVFTADQPGCTFALTQAAGVSNDSGSIDCGGQHPLSGVTLISPYLVVRINSGADKLRGLWLQPRGRDGTTSPFFNHGSHATADADPHFGAYQDGDVLTLICPPVGQADFGTAGPLTACNVYVRATLRTGGTANVSADGAGTVSVTILDAGIGIVS